MAAQQPQNGGQEIALHGHTITPLLPVRQPINGNGYGVPEGGPNNGWSFAGQQEPIPVPQRRDNNTVALGGHLGGLGGLQNYSPHNPLATWAVNTSQADNPKTDFVFRTANNGQPPRSA
ncbi:hypothetical protein V502_07759 [Pseudogymnoascus sp. VKM F-4520 (FW-2644)]|nr:hypothetical protein V502_07759 [Pseudogymnoascus sp. VKM F-4520 (FW-2644)]